MSCKVTSSPRTSPAGCAGSISDRSGGDSTRLWRCCTEVTMPGFCAMLTAFHERRVHRRERPGTGGEAQETRGCLDAEFSDLARKPDPNVLRRRFHFGADLSPGNARPL